MIKKSHCIAPVFGIIWALAGVAQAQPDVRNNPKGANPPAMPNFGNWQNMTAAERQEAMKKLTDQTLRDALKRIGINDEKTQVTILQFAEVQEKNKQNVRLKAQKLAQALANNVQTDEQIAELMKEVRQAVDEAKAGQKADLVTLEQLTEYSKKPKLQAVLTMMGLIGDETLFMQTTFGNFMNIVTIMMEPPAAPAAAQANPPQN